MLNLRDALVGKPVLSLRTGQFVATTTGFVINPNNLKIEGFYCADSLSKKELILLYQDIRDFLPQGFVVDDHSVLSEPEELVRLKKIIELRFDLIGKQVITVGRQRLGKINDFATEVETMYVQKIYVAQGFMKSLTGGNLGIDRSQIHEITNTKIIVLDPLEGGAVRAAATA